MKLTIIEINVKRLHNML